MRAILAAALTALFLGAIATAGDYDDRTGGSTTASGTYVSGGTDVALADGGTNASLTAVNGGVCYSSASALALTSAGSSGQILRSAGAASPTWTTQTFPTTCTANQLDYCSSTNTQAGLTSCASGVLVTDGSSVPSCSTTIPSVTVGSLTGSNANGPQILGGTAAAFNVPTLIPDKSHATSGIGYSQSTPGVSVVSAGVDIVEFASNAAYFGGNQTISILIQGASTISNGSADLHLNDNVEVTGIEYTVRTTLTPAASATTIAITRNIHTVDCDSGGNTIATITGGKDGQLLTLKFVDTSCILTDTGSGSANTLDLSAAFVSTANDTLTLMFDGTSWFEVARSLN